MSFFHIVLITNMKGLRLQKLSKVGEANEKVKNDSEQNILFKTTWLAIPKKSIVVHVHFTIFFYDTSHIIDFTFAWQL